jgi:DNA polymerase delta subunit 1
MSKFDDFDDSMLDDEPDEEEMRSLDKGKESVQTRKRSHYEDFDELDDNDDDNDNDKKKRRIPSSSSASSSSFSSPSSSSIEFDVDADQKTWDRPEALQLDTSLEDLEFQVMDITYRLDDYISGMPGPRVSPVPVIRLFGVSRRGNSVMADLYGFVPYFYIPAPPEFVESEHGQQMLVALNAQMRQKLGNVDENRWDVKHDAMVVRLSVVERQSLMGFSGEAKQRFVKIELASPRYVPKLRKLLERGLFEFLGRQRSFLCYEAAMPYTLRFMIDRGLVGGAWCQLLASKYVLRARGSKKSSCQYEAAAAAADAIAHDATGPYASIAPLRVLSFDIECAGRKGHFPDPKHDPVIQIASVVRVVGCVGPPRVQNVFTWRPSGQLPLARIYNCSSEAQMLVEWKRFVQRADPDIFTGYNIANFDWYYLIERARKLRADEFALLGRENDSRVRIAKSTFSSAAYGTRESRSASISGRIQFDMLQVIMRQAKLRSYTLNNVAAHYLGQQKEDVHHSIITTLWDGSDDDRHRLASYCLKDALLPLRLLEKLMCLINYVEMARVTGVPFDYLLSRGQTIRVLSKLYRCAREEGLLVPSYSRTGGADGSIQYEGATVVQPAKGYYSMPISTLDFSSLYPSIMMAHNLCYTTLVKPDEARRLPAEDYVVTPSGDHFVKAHRRRGLLPRILDDLLAARRQAKRDLARETDPFKKAVLDGRQLALKVTANSVYGFTGAARQGQLPCLAISASVTAYGRKMIDDTKRLVEERYTVENGFAHDAKVIYGDTDSVMIKFGSDDLAECMRLGLEAAEYVTGHFVKPINLEFEKAYHPYLLISKKRYAGLLFTKPERHDYIDAKGIESVRRDNCRMAKQLIERILHLLLIERDVDGAVKHTQNVIARILQNKMDLSMLIISKNLSKEEYKAKQPHVELAKRMRLRDAATAPSIGDRVPYVIIKGPKNAPTSDRAEDPLYVLEHRLAIDTQYYVDNQLRNPLHRIFKALLPNTNVLFAGEHTRAITVTASRSIGIGAFTVRTETCLGCRVVLHGTQKTLCDHCRQNAAAIYQRELRTVRDNEQRFHALWTQCQECQGSLHQPVLCTNKDCDIFYMRKKIAFDLESATEKLQRFNLDW